MQQLLATVCIYTVQWVIKCNVVFYKQFKLLATGLAYFTHSFFGSDLICWHCESHRDRQLINVATPLTELLNMHCNYGFLSLCISPFLSSVNSVFNRIIKIF